MNRNDRAIVGLVMLAHAMVHTYELSIPILVSIWLAEFPVTPATIGLVVTVGTALFGLGALPAGVLADAYGSQRLIVGCLLGMGAAFVALGFAPSIPTIALALVLWGAAASVYHPAGLSLISKGVSRRGEAFAYHGMAGNLGIALGPLLTTLLLVVVEWRLAVGLLAVPAAVAAAIALAVDIDETAAVPDEVAVDGGEPDGLGKRDAADEPDDVGRATGSVRSLEDFLGDARALFTGAFIVVFAVVILSGLFYRGVLTFLPELLSALPVFDPVTVGGRALEPARYLYAGLLMVGIGGQYVGGKLTDRIPTEYGLAVFFGLLALVAAAFVPAIAAGLGALLVVSALLGFTLFTVQPFYQATVAEYTPPEARGLSYGFTYLGVFGVGALGAVLAGSALTYGDRDLLFLVFAGVAALASLLSVGLSVRTRRG